MDEVEVEEEAGAGAEEGVTLEEGILEEVFLLEDYSVDYLEGLSECFTNLISTIRTMTRILIITITTYGKPLLPSPSQNLSTLKQVRRFLGIYILLLIMPTGYYKFRSYPYGYK